MKRLLSSLLLFGISYKVHGLVCFSCSDYDYNGEKSRMGNCFTPIASGANETPNVTCEADSNGATYYCKTKFTIHDGVAIAVERGCALSTRDEDIYTDGVPGNDKCVTTIRTYNPIDTTEYYSHCNTDKCNKIAQSSPGRCTTDCNTGNSGGSCNYITRTCVCNNGFSGDDCGTKTNTAMSASRSCVQCNSLTDSGCANATTSSACPGSETFCSTATTAIYDTSYTVIRTVTTRGCTSALRAVDECAFTNIYTDPPISDSSVGYNEFTCVSTCDTDGCNTNTADGILNGNEAVRLQCVQCNDTTGSGRCNSQMTRTMCPIGSTHCKTTVTYLISNRSDLSYSESTPSYKLLSNIRECATAAVTSQCTSTAIGNLSFAKVTCTETCQTDGCNTGWPARPKCIKCSSASVSYGDGFDECAENPPEAKDCSFPYQSYCTLQEDGIKKGTSKSVRGFPHRVKRNCSHVDIGTRCSSSTIRSVEIENCNRTCTTDGCNVGSGSNIPTDNGDSNMRGSNIPTDIGHSNIQTMATLIAPVVLGRLALHL